MATEDGYTGEADAGYHPWVAAAVAGLAAGVAMGVILSLGTGLMPLIGALYGMDTFLGGWIAHLANSVVFAFLFAAALSRAIVRRENFPVSTYAAIGVVYGAFLGLVTGGLLFPLWLNAGSDAGLPFPFLPFLGESFVVFTLLLSVAHLVYGAVLGTTYAVVCRSAGR